MCPNLPWNDAPIVFHKMRCCTELPERLMCLVLYKIGLDGFVPNDIQCNIIPFINLALLWD
jgi:hypothetical protein